MSSFSKGFVIALSLQMTHFSPRVIYFLIMLYQQCDNIPIGYLFNVLLNAEKMYDEYIFSDEKVCETYIFSAKTVAVFIIWRSKSAKFFYEKFHPAYVVRTSMSGAIDQGWIRNIPLWAIQSL